MGGGGSSAEFSVTSKRHFTVMGPFYIFLLSRRGGGPGQLSRVAESTCMQTVYSIYDREFYVDVPEKACFYTGLPSVEIIDVVFEFVEQHMTSSVKLNNNNNKYIISISSGVRAGKRNKTKSLIIFKNRGHIGVIISMRGRRQFKVEKQF